MTELQQPNEETEAAEPGVRSPILHALTASLFSAWHRAIETVARALHRAAGFVRAAARSWIAQWALARQYHAMAAEPWPPDTKARNTAAALGVRAFAFGLALAGITMAASRGLWLPGVITVISEALWAGMRFIIIALLMPRGAITRSRLYVAYLAGLLPYVFGATWLLRLAALALSAVLTYRGLLGAGVSKQDAKVTLGWSFGGQVGIITGGWLVRALIALVAGA